MWLSDDSSPASRFEEAMESLTATHQLSASIHGLGICVRPLLLAGLENTGNFDKREAAAEVNKQLKLTGFG